MYAPPQSILQRYADLLVSFALDGGKGPKPGQVVQLVVPEPAKPLLPELVRAVLDAKAHPKTRFVPSSIERVFFEHSDDTQLSFFPEAYKREEVALVDHQVSILSEHNPTELASIDPKKIFRTMDARRKTRDWLNAKEERGAFSWTLALYGTDAMAKNAGLTLEQYWEQIILACFLDSSDPIAEWKRVQKEQERMKKALNALEIEWVHIESQSIDLHVQLGPNRRWLGGSCRNIPSFELFISPDWRGTKGVVAFNQPLFRYGNILKGVSLTFNDGLVTKASASEGENVLLSMLERKNANRIGEFSLTDRRFSRITKFMANTLFDENIGGAFGNTHIALGRAYRDSFPGVMSSVSEEQWEAMGFNESPEHTDIISTEDRTVTATLPRGERLVIFRDGQFTV